jgi:outer membrane protein TolC
VAESEARVRQARQSVLAARVALAEALGLTLQQPADAPWAADFWPPPPDSEVVSSWNGGVLGDYAMSHRYDIEALRHRETAAGILARGARSDLKRRIDLSLTLAYRGLYEGDNPSDLVWRGYGDALWGEYAGPSIQVALDFDLPFNNNAARGRLVQARSLEQETGIRRQDLERVVRNDIEERIGTLISARAERDHRRASVQGYERLLGSETEKFRAGESSVVSVVLTEQQLLGEQLALVAAERALAVLITQLRFDLGVLVQTGVEGGELVVKQISPLGYRFRP